MIERTKANGKWTGGRGNKSPIPREVRAKQWRKQFTDTHPTYYRAVQLKKLYDISIEDYNNLFRECGGLCAVCRCPETAVDPRKRKTRELGVDHDHKTNMVRGLLCSNCNRALGFLQDDPVRIRALANYVESYRHE